MISTTSTLVALVACLMLVQLGAAESLEKRVDFTFQSQRITLGQWLELLTLCLAPLVAHIAVGVPTPIYLQCKRPAWHERIGHYNPTSIFWRYFAITDRRVRAKAWNSADMAASNADFWTDQGWDGSEKMMRESRIFCTRIPAGNHIDLLSASTAKTLVITLQGMQALYAILMGIFDKRTHNFAYRIALHYVSFPLATIGLVRLLAALWLTDDYAYVDYNLLNEIAASDTPRSPVSIITAAQSRTQSNMGQAMYSSNDTYHRPSSWRGIAVRAVFLGLLLCLLGMTLYYISPVGKAVFTATVSAVNLFYILFVVGAIAILSVYFLLGQSCTTIIPCIEATWYKIYTCVLFIMMMGLIILASLETRETHCGKYTTYRPKWDSEICAKRDW